MKPILLEIIRCPSCTGVLSSTDESKALVCQNCQDAFPLVNGIPLFNQPPPEMIPSEKIARGPELGTPWRQANWRFLKEQVEQLDHQALILDVGAGRGDFAAALEGRASVALEVYPYPEVDLVCDLTQTNPFRPASFDAILLLNVLEHVYDTHALLQSLAGLLKTGGKLIMAIPFMVKLHQTPVDFVRYTHFALQRLGDKSGLQVVLLEGYYDPLFFLGEGIGNLRNAILPEMTGPAQRFNRRLASLRLRMIQALASQLQPSLRQIGYLPGKTISPDTTQSMAPTGYHVVYQKG